MVSQPAISKNGKIPAKVLGVGALLLGLSLCMASEVCAEPRKPHVAGQFYPAGQSELLELVQGFISGQPEPTVADKPRALIVPHAGYQYSGPVAGSAFRLVQGHHYDGVVVVGFTHRFPFDGISVDTRESYETPLGLIPVDLDAVEFLQSFAPRGAGPVRSLGSSNGAGASVQPPALRHHEEAHAAVEHSLEVMLPFLQVALGEFRLIPVIMGRASLDETSQLAEALAALAQRGDYLFVFSTDLSHYHAYETARQIDARTIEAMLFETPQAVDRLFAFGQAEACGRGPVVASLFLAAKLGYLKREFLSYANSGDTAGDKSQGVVGYTAIGMFDRPASTQGRLSEEAGMALVGAARESLERTLIHGEEPQPIPLDAHPELARSSGVFVTLRRNGLLCGCIGRVETDEPLASSVPIVALDAALRDARFEPVRGEDLDEIHVEVSVLTPRRRLEDLRELVPGRDGVVLEYQGRSGVFLPVVWESSGWTRVKFLRELASQKAGLPPEAWRKARLYVFQDQIFEEASDSPTAH